MRFFRDITGIFVPRRNKNSSRKRRFEISEFEINKSKQQSTSQIQGEWDSVRDRAEILSFYGPSAKRAVNENKEGKNEDPQLAVRTQQTRLTRRLLYGFVDYSGFEKVIES